MSVVKYGSKVYYSASMICCQWLLLNMCMMFFPWQNNTYWSYANIWGNQFCSETVIFLYIKTKIFQITLQLGV